MATADTVASPVPWRAVGRMKSIRVPGAIAVCCLVLWLVLNGFARNEESADQLLHAGRVIAAALWVGLVLLAAWGAGVLVLGGAPGMRPRSAESGYLLLALGLVMLIYAFFLLLAAGWFSVWTIHAVLLPLAVRGGIALRGVAVRRPEALSGAGILPALVLGLGALFAILCLTPVRDYDALIYHLVAAQAWADAGRFVQIHNNVYTHFPMNIQVLYAGALPTCGWLGVKLLNAALGLLGAWGAYLLGRRLAGNAAGWIAALAYLGSPIVGRLMTSALIDLGLTFFALAVVLSVLRWRTDPRMTSACLAAVFCGAAFSSKYTAALTVILPCLVLVLSAARQVSMAAALRAAALLALGTVLLFVPWGIKSLVFTGNPFFPLFYELLGGEGWTAERARVFANAHRSILWSDGLTLTLVAQQALEWFRTHPVLPAAVGLGAILFPWRRPPEAGRALWGALLLGLGLWATLTQGEERFLVPLVPLAGALAGTGVAAVAENLARRVLLALLVLLCGTGAWFALMDYAFDYPAAIRQVFRGMVDYDFRFYPEQEAIARINALHEIDPRTRVLFIGEARAFGCRAPFLAPTVFDSHPLLTLTSVDETGPERAAALRAAGFTHLFYNTNELIRLRRDYRAFGANETDEISRRALEILRCCGRVVYDAQLPPDKAVMVIEIGGAQ